VSRGLIVELLRANVLQSGQPVAGRAGFKALSIVAHCLAGSHTTCRHL
jgi:hypothetical protein